MSLITNRIVERVGPKGNSLLVNSTWYSAFKADALSGAKAGDMVSFEFVEKASDNPERPFRNIKGSVKIVALGEPGAASVPPSRSPASSTGARGEFPISKASYQRSIIRQNAVSSAINFAALQTGTKPMEKILGWAKEIEHFTSGDDVAEAMQALADEVKV